MKKKDRIFSAVTGKTNKIKSFGTSEAQDPQEAQEDSAYVANLANEPWFSVADSNINKSYSRQKLKHTVFGGYNSQWMRI